MINFTLVPDLFLSNRLSLDFPYEYSNPFMADDIFIVLVLEKARFMDVLKISHYFGVDRVKKIAKEYEGEPQGKVLDRHFRCIEKGVELENAKIR